MKKFQVCRYFDDHFEKVVSEWDTRAEADSACNLYKPGAYVSYEVREVNE